MSRFRVVLTDFIADDLAPERGVLADIADVVALNARSTADLFGRVEDADALIGYHLVTFPADLLRRLTRCKLLVRGGVGYDNVDAASARTLGLSVANVPDYGTEEVADSAIGLMLSLTRGLNAYNSRWRRGVAKFSHTEAGRLVRLRGRTFAVVGLGRIGTAAARRAQALGMSVAFFDPLKPDGYDKALGVRRVERLEELLEEAFVLSLHCPLTPATRNLIGAAEIDRMPDASYLVNTARGAVLDPTAIPPAIYSGKLAGAGIDVLPDEPPADDHPLLRAWRDPSDPCHDRVILTPHAAFYSDAGLLDIRVKAAEAVRRALLGEPVRNVVN